MDAPGRTPDQIEADIERQREQLAATVTQLHARLDMKTRAKRKLDELIGRPEIAAAGVLGVVALVALVVWRRR